MDTNCNFSILYQFDPNNNENLPLLLTFVSYHLRSIIVQTNEVKAIIKDIKISNTPTSPAALISSANTLVIPAPSITPTTAISSTTLGYCCEYTSKHKLQSK